jgi:polysaccharide deacetylase family protein (PEP-CTERM system associated)
MSTRAAKQSCIFSVDVEDWFHILDVAGLPRMEQWASLPSIVETSFARLLDLFDERGVRVTCFFLGWIAERYPHLVREAVRRGHEPASHGYGHELTYRLSRAQFLQDVRHSKKLIEDIAGRPVLGYRSPGFSCTAEVPWFFGALIEAGYQYDSSVFPGRHAHGGLAGAELGPYRVFVDGASLQEFPMSVVRIGGSQLCFFGGGYLRLFPYPLVRHMAERVMAEDRPVIFYTHPREIEPTQPRLPMNLVRRFKSYVNLASTEAKLRSILQDFEVRTFEAFMETQTRPLQQSA